MTDDRKAEIIAQVKEEFERLFQATDFDYSLDAYSREMYRTSVISYARISTTTTTEIQPPQQTDTVEYITIKTHTPKTIPYAIRKIDNGDYFRIKYCYIVLKLSQWNEFIASYNPDTVPANYCDSCGGSFEAPELSNMLYDNYEFKVCSSCEDEYSTCHGCEQFVHDDDDHSTASSGNMYCDRCADYTYYCDGCEEYYDDEESTSLHDAVYCNSCFNDRGFYCDGCDEAYSRDNMYFCEACENSYCSDCYDAHNEDGHNDESEPRARLQEAVMRDARNNNPFRSITLDPIRGKAKGKILTIDRLIGVEIEGQHGDPYNLGNDLPKEAGCCHDASVPDGLEVQTPPASLAKAETIIKNTCEALNKHGYKGTKSCGVHVHVDASDIRNNHEKILQVIKTFYATEDMLFSMLPPSRWSQHYCQGLYERYLYDNFRKKSDIKDVQKTWYRIKDEDYNSEDNLNNILDMKVREKYEQSRYFGLNVHSIFYRGTIELRYHSGTTNPTKILNWAQLMLKMIDWAINSYDEKTIKILFDMPTSKQKQNLFLKTFGITKSKKLTEYVKERTEKFNPKFAIKFNKGKGARTHYRRQATMLRNKFDALVQAEAKNRLRYLKREKMYNSGHTGLVTDEEVDKYVLPEQDRERLAKEALYQAKNYFQGRLRTVDINLLEKEGGFTGGQDLERIRDELDRANGEGVEL